MQCPGCGFDNLPGSDECTECHTSLTQEDLPSASIESGIEQSLAEDTVATLKPVDGVSTPETTSLDVAIAIMRQKSIGCLLITDADGKLSGIITERDLVNKVAGLVDDLTAHTVSEFMTPRPETVRAEQLLAGALQSMMVGDFRYLPLVDDQGRPTQIISSRDIIGYLTQIVVALSDSVEA